MRTKAEGDSSVRWGERFDPFHDPYLADPYPFFAEARAASPVFYSPDLDYWVVTRYHDIRQIFQTPKRFSAANTLAPLQPVLVGGEREGVEERQQVSTRRIHRRAAFPAAARAATAPAGSASISNVTSAMVRVASTKNAASMRETSSVGW